MSKPRFYTTTVPASRRIGKLMELLSTHANMIGSSHIIHERGQPVAVAVEINGVGYKVRPSIEGIRTRMEEEGVLGRSGTAEPIDVAWAQLYTLLEMQLEAVASGVAEVEDVLGGFAMMREGFTVGELIRERRTELAPGAHPLLTSGGGA